MLLALAALNSGRVSIFWAVLSWDSVLVFHNQFRCAHFRSGYCAIFRLAGSQGLLNSGFVLNMNLSIMFCKAM